MRVMSYELWVMSYEFHGAVEGTLAFMPSA